MVPVNVESDLGNLDTAITAVQQAVQADNSAANAVVVAQSNKAATADAVTKAQQNLQQAVTQLQSDLSVWENTAAQPGPLTADAPFGPRPRPPFGPRPGPHPGPGPRPRPQPQPQPQPQPVQGDLGCLTSHPGSLLALQAGFTPAQIMQWVLEYGPGVLSVIEQLLQPKK